MNKKEKIRIIRLLLKQYEKDKNILNSLNGLTYILQLTMKITIKLHRLLKKIIYFIEYN